MTDTLYFNVEDLLAAQKVVEQEAGAVRAPFTASQLIEIVSEEIHFLRKMGWSAEDVAEEIREISGKQVTAEDIELNAVPFDDIYGMPGGGS